MGFEDEIAGGLNSLFHAELYAYSDIPEQALLHLQAVKESMNRWQSGVLVQYAEIAAGANRNHELAEAIREFDAISKTPDGLMTELVLALAGKSVVNKSLEKKLALTGQHPLAQIEVAGRLAQEKKLDEARQVASQAIAHLVGNIMNHGQIYQPKQLLGWDPDALVKILTGLGLFQEALQLVLLFLKERPTDRTLIGFAVFCLRQLGDDRQALHYARLAALLDVRNADVYRRLADILETLADWAGAFEIRRKVIELAGSPSREDWLSFARSGIEFDELASATEACDHLLAENANDGVAKALLGQVLLKQGDREKGMAHLKDATQFAPHEPLPWVMLADACEATGEKEQALEVLRAAAITLPGSLEILAKLADTFLQVGDYAEALPYLEKAAKLAPDSISQQQKLGETLLALGFLPEAKKVLVGAHERWRANPRLAYLAAKTHIESGEPEEGLVALEVAVHDSEPIFDALVLYAKTLLNPDEARRDLKPKSMQKIVDARMALAKALSIHPDDFEAQLLMAEILAAEGVAEIAFEHFRQLSELPEAQQSQWRWRVQKGLGQTALMTRRMDTALAALQEAAQTKPDMPDIQRSLAQAFLANDLRQDAYQAALSSLKLAPDDISALFWFGELMLELGATKEGIDALQQALQREPANGNGWLRLAEAQAQNQDSTSARKSLKTLLELEGATVEQLQQAAKIHLQMGDARLALKSLEQAVHIGGSPSKELLRELASLREGIGDLAGALSAVQKASEEFPGDAGLMLYESDLLARLEQTPAAIQRLFQALEHCEEMDAGEALMKQNEKSVEPFTYPRSGHTPKSPSHQAAIHARLSSLLRQSADLPQALFHAEKAIEADPASIPARLLAADIARSLLETDKAARYLQFDGDGSNVTDQAQVTLACLQAENLLDGGQAVEAGKVLRDVEAMGGQHPRYLAAKARQLARVGDLDSARELYRSAKKLYEQQSANQLANPQKTLNTPPATLRGELMAGDYWMADAAEETAIWDDAITFTAKTVRDAPQEPRPHLDLARRLVIRAGQQRLAEELGMSTGKPDAKVAADMQQQFADSIRKARQLSEADEIRLWERLGNAIFSPDIQKAQALMEPNLPDACLPWVVQAFRLTGDCAAGIEAGKRAAQQPAVGLQLGLCYMADDPVSGLVAVRQAVDANPNDPLHHAALSLLAEKTGDCPLALRSIQQALTMSPDEIDWQMRAARLAAQCGQIDVAQNHWEAAYQLDSSRVDIGLNLGEVYLRQGLPQKSVEILQKLVRLKPDEAQLWLMLSKAHQEMGARRKAIECAERAGSLDRQSAAPYLQCVDIALEDGDTATAHGFARKAIERNPVSPEPYLAHARIFVGQDHLEAAQQQLERSPEAIRRSIPVQTEIARLIWQMEGAQAALPQVQDLASVTGGDNADVMALLANVLAETGDVNGAAAAIHKSLRVNPQQPHLNLLMGSIQHKAGNLDQAIHYYSEAILQKPTELKAYLELGNVYEERREHIQALSTYEKAIQVAPLDARPYFRAAQVLRESKDYPGAEGMLRKAARLAPEDVNIRRQLGAILALNLVHHSQEAHAQR